MKVSFLIPAYNEAATIGEVLKRIAQLGLDAQVIVVDDGSSDETAAIAEAAGATVIRQANAGKGAAIRAAIPLVEGDIAVIQDADMEYDPADVPALIAPIEDGVADVVFGSRLSGGRPQRVHLFWHLVGNRFLSLLTCVLFNTTLSDMETGYKAFRSEILRSLDCAKTASGSNRRSPARFASRSCASTSSRSHISGAPTKRARTSPGATGFAQCGCSSACGSAADQRSRRRRARSRTSAAASIGLGAVTEKR